MTCVNLGCGRDVREGWVNVDRHPYPGVEVADVEHGLPFQDDSVDVVYASHVLEHVRDLDFVIREIHRILKPGGIFEVKVPYGLRSLYNPFHLHAFLPMSFDPFIADGVGLQSASLFTRRSIRVYRKPPFEWHLRKYLPSLDLQNCRIGLRNEIHIVLEKRADT